jgi:hypothetical protein
MFLAGEHSSSAAHDAITLPLSNLRVFWASACSSVLAVSRCIGAMHRIPETNFFLHEGLRKSQPSSPRISARILFTKQTNHRSSECTLLEHASIELLMEHYVCMLP